MADGDIGQQGAAEHLDDAGHDPAGPADEHAGPPALGRLGGFQGHEAQVVDLLAHLCDQRQADRHGGAEQGGIEAAGLAVLAGVVGQAGEGLWVVPEQEGVGQHQQRQPDRLSQGL
ncbi:MAG: hypothetical protein IPG66_17975 [Hydrogenophilales bacterium]|nr:hypothetical protein [Hydrogenophilales bacterium]